MGIFGIKTRKEKQAEAERLRKAKDESELLGSIKYWSHAKCYDELEAYEKGNRPNYSWKVIEAIKKQKQKEATESMNHRKRLDLDKKIAAKKAEIERLKARDPWTYYGGGGGMYMKVRSTTTDEAMAAEVRAAERELARLQNERNNIGKSMY